MMYSGMFFRPWPDLKNLKKDIHRVMSDVLGSESAREDGFWQPPVEIAELPEAYLVAVELPGVNKADIKISFLDNTLQLSGERKSLGDKTNRLRSEFWHGPFRRSIHLPGPANQEKITASYENGILNVTLPKLEPSRGREIKIEMS